jgi:NADH-quinone oxidoreductase subunit F
MSEPLTPIEPAVELSSVDAIVAQVGRERRLAIPLLQAVQAHYGYLPPAALVRLCEVSEVTPAQVEGVASFYSQFRRMPAGRHLISVCHGTACHVAGAEKVTDAVRRHLGLEGEADTDAARLFTVQKVACLGCCSLAPVMRIDGRTYGHLSAETVPRVIEQFLRRGAGRPADALPAPVQAAAKGRAAEVRVGLGSCCMASGSGDVRERLDAELRALGAEAQVKCGACLGLCHRVPLVDFMGADGRRARYANVTPAAVRGIVGAQVRPKGVLRKARATLRRAGALLTTDAAWQPPGAYELDADSDPVRAFLAKQVEIVLEGRGEMDPLDVDEYRARGGYSALERCLREMTPEEVIGTVEESGLRGRGGAGYPTGLKWATVRRQPGAPKYIVLNGDEGDPGAFMDRMLMESYPHRILEGLAIAAYAVGADEAFLYIRAEYPLAVARVREAMRRATERGLLGERMMGSGFSLRMQIMEGAGAFVCGEETGLIASLEGRRGMPSFRPPYPAEHGLWGRPTSVNNAETYASVPWIIRNGAEAFDRIGTPTSKGTKVFALAGKVVRGGLIEVPMGITIGEIVEEIGGGIRDGRAFKAVQIGGPSGGCIPASLRETRIDYEELVRLGAMMGSGGLVVMDDTACMVDMARFFLRFTQAESCGKCTFCRIGTRRMLEVLDRICEGQAKPADLDRLEELAERVRRTSLCGLGQSAPNPVLTTLRYFRDEYEAHLQGRCPAGRCRALITYTITDECFGCTLCAQNCPAGAIEARPYERHEIDPAKCIRCGTCAAVCTAKAVEVR